MTGFSQRVVGSLIVGAMILYGLSLPRPPPATGPQFSEVIEPAVEASAKPSLWYCPWINSGASRETRVAVAYMAEVDMTFTHPDPRVGEPADIGFLDSDGAGAAVQDIAEIVNRGAAPGFIEFSNGPATATAIVTGDGAASGDRCVGSLPRRWHIAGLTTADGYGLTLRIFNPLPDNAKVQVRAASELGSEALPDLQSIDVIGRTWVDIDLARSIPFLDNLVITVETEEGTVIPTIVQSLEAEEANWSGTGLSTEWFFPTATLAGMSPRLAVWNPNDGPVDVEVDLFTRTAGFGAVFSATLEAGRPGQFQLSDESTGAVGVRVRATGPVAAVVVAEDLIEEIPNDDEPDTAPGPRRIAGTIGAPEESARWLLPGAGAFLGGDSSIWLLNTSAEPVTVTVQPLGRSEIAADKVRIEATSFTRIRLTANANVSGYLIESAIPITASWSLRAPGAVALFAGVAIGE